MYYLQGEIILEVTGTCMMVPQGLDTAGHRVLKSVQLWLKQSDEVHLHGI